LRSPDAAWIEAGRWDALSEAEKNRFSRICPDLVVEPVLHYQPSAVEGSGVIAGFNLVMARIWD
jgi:hypothetical protein